MSVEVLLDYELLLEIELPCPEKRLLVAVIHRAILDIYGQDIQPFYQHEAARWLFSDSHSPMSLYWVCTWLSDDPQWLQQSIRNMVKQRKMLKGPIMRVDR